MCAARMEEGTHLLNSGLHNVERKAQCLGKLFDHQ